MSPTQLPLSGLVPAGITCSLYQRGEGKRCLHYLPDHNCARESVGACTEWLKRNPHREPSTQPSFPPAACGISPSPSTDTPPAAPAVDLTRLRGFTTEDIDSFRALGLEVRLECDLLGELWLVPSYTGQARRELTPEHAATLLHVMSVFPGSRVVAFQPSTKPTIPSKEPSL